MAGKFNEEHDINDQIEDANASIRADLADDRAAALDKEMF